VTAPRPTGGERLALAVWPSTGNHRRERLSGSAIQPLGGERRAGDARADLRERDLA
jgi:hypothetical protein